MIFYLWAIFLISTFHIAIKPVKGSIVFFHGDMQPAQPKEIAGHASACRIIRRLKALDCSGIIAPIVILQSFGGIALTLEPDLQGNKHAKADQEQDAEVCFFHISSPALEP